VLFVRLTAILVLPALACSQGKAELSFESQIGLEIEAPERGTISPGRTVTVRGHVDNMEPVDWIAVEGRRVEVDESGTFELTLTVPPGLNLLHTEARLNDGSRDRDTRAILAGQLTSPETPAERALRMELSSETISTIGATAGRVLAETDLTSALAAAGPIMKTGTGCFQATAEISSLEVGDIAVSAEPTQGGFELDLLVTGISARAGARYSAACLDGNVSVGFSADSYHVQATVYLTVSDGKIVSDLEIHDSDIDDFVIALTGIEFLDDALTNVDWIAGPALGWLIESRLASTFGDVLGAVATRDLVIPVANTELTVQARPQMLELREDGGRLEVSLSVFSPDMDNPGYTTTPVDTPIDAQPDPFAGFDVRIDDEAFHQALTSLWSAGLLTQEVDAKTLGVGDFGGNLAAISIDAKLPPAVYFGEMNEAPALVLGDLIIELIGPKYSHAAVAVSAKMILSAAERPDLGPGRTVLHAQPTLEESSINVLFIDERSRDLLDEELVVAITQAVLKRAANQVGESAGLIALPTFGGTTLTGPSLRTRPGYLQLEGELGVAE